MELIRLSKAERESAIGWRSVALKAPPVGSDSPVQRCIIRCLSYFIQRHFKQ